MQERGEFCGWREQVPRESIPSDKESFEGIAPQREASKRCDTSRARSALSQWGEKASRKS